MVEKLRIDVYPPPTKHESEINVLIAGRTAQQTDDAGHDPHGHRGIY